MKTRAIFYALSKSSKMLNNIRGRHVTQRYINALSDVLRLKVQTFTIMSKKISLRVLV